ncbi:MAG: flagellar biosynthetic protein FliR [Rhodocyclaceae bacterium]|nr:flagellar biosynthetic protein FliR [Rhodocyclaceae bacterium]MBK6553901.1 flagellar biosynthetic protein FliR [Rhodocyclaceae bacterium]MBK9310821.1 flagellar biosynthetic protein FliR [Rhodocyclaceae bacterium]
MLTISSAQLDAWLAAFVFPLARLLGLMASAPVFSNAGMPRRVRLVAGLAVTMAIAPALPPMPAIATGSWQGLFILAEQAVIGVLLGLTLRIVFAAVDVAGELIGLQMGLAFAVFYDPQNSGQTPVLSEFLGLLATLIFLAMNGHLLCLAVLIESFQLLPVGGAALAAGGFRVLATWMATMFSAGVLLSLPLVAALLIANIAMGVLSRVAPQLNLFAVGFPVTMVSGFVVLMISLPYFGAAMEHLFDQGFAALRMVLRASAGAVP